MLFPARLITSKNCQLAVTDLIQIDCEITDFEINNFGVKSFILAVQRKLIRAELLKNRNVLLILLMNSLATGESKSPISRLFKSGP